MDGQDEMRARPFRPHQARLPSRRYRHLNIHHDQIGRRSGQGEIQAVRGLPGHLQVELGIDTGEASWLLAIVSDRMRIGPKVWTLFDQSEI
jgi:hypothetical protein